MVFGFACRYGFYTPDDEQGLFEERFSEIGLEFWNDSPDASVEALPETLVESGLEEGGFDSSWDHDVSEVVWPETFPMEEKEEIGWTESAREEMGNEEMFVEPTCSDGLQNGDELGIDCGGSCPPCPYNILVVNATSDQEDTNPGDGLCLVDPPEANICTLRAAIQEANALANLEQPDRILFAIPESDPGFNQSDRTFTIAVGQAPNGLPKIIQPVYLDGWSQRGPNYPGPPVIVLDGTQTVDTGIHISNTTDCLIRGLVVQRFGNIGIMLALGGGHRISGCYVGTDASGLSQAPNRTGIRIESSDNLIGGSRRTFDQCDFECNLVSGNLETGILLLSSDIDPASRNQLSGNFIGTDFSGLMDLGNETGVVLDSIDWSVWLEQTHIGSLEVNQGNLIAGNRQDGIFMGGNRIRENWIEGNWIGIGSDGETAVANQQNGIQVIDHYLPGLSIQGNVISGNAKSGALLVGSTANQINFRGNRIGTNVYGDRAVGNGEHGIFIDRADTISVGELPSGSYDWICDEDCNLISGNALSGVQIQGGPVEDPAGNDNPPDNPFIYGNFIGTDLSGQHAIPNGVGIGVFGPMLCGLQVRHNLISANSSYGINFQSALAANCFAVPHYQILDNRIGTEQNGLNPLPNGSTGLYVHDVGLHADRVDPIFIYGNLVSANRGNGIEFSGNTFGILMGRTDATQVENWIGLGIDQFTPLPNTGIGILIGSLSHDIGLNSNQVAYHPGDGIQINGQVITLSRNLVYENQGLDINLVGGIEDGFGVTQNDDLDLDAGPNQLQNFADLVSASWALSRLTISGSLHTQPNASYSLEIFLVHEDPLWAHPSGHGGSRGFLCRFENLSTNALGVFDFTSVPLECSTNQNLRTYLISSIVTDSFGNSSEFGANLTVQ